MKERKKMRGKYFFSVLLTVVLIFAQFPANVRAEANTAGSDLVKAQAETSVGKSVDGTTYYVDAVNGDDSRDGTSEAKAWKTFKNVNQRKFQPSDHILLKAGSVWNEQLYPKGSGSEGRPIIIDYYGEGRKPVINGNGTKPEKEIVPRGMYAGKKNVVITGAVQLYNQEYWEIRNLEVTNSTDLSNRDAYLFNDDKLEVERAGILAYSDNQKYIYSHIVVKDCYVHDVTTKLQAIYGSPVCKATGGIIILGNWLDMDGVQAVPAISGNPESWRSKAGFKDVLIEGNYVERVAQEGIRTKCDGLYSGIKGKYSKNMSNIVVRNNYLQEIAGDGIVLAEINDGGGLVEYNIVKKACNADWGRKNFASLWLMSANNVMVQYNEVYGTTYGYLDGEAFDVDVSCQNNTYQYNFSHHNGGGFILFMGSDDGSVIRYNISANDGGGIKGTGKHFPNNIKTDYNFSAQGLIHTAKKNVLQTHKIYNNTFYIGDGITTSLFDECYTSVKPSTYSVGSFFKNNIIYKEGAGNFYWVLSAGRGGGLNESKLYGYNKDLYVNYIQNNILYNESGNEEYFATSGATIEKLIKAGNIFEDPLLMDPAGVSAYKDGGLAYSKDADIYKYTSVASLRSKLEGFKIQEGSPALMNGKQIEKAPDKDIFGNAIGNLVDIGAHQLTPEAGELAVDDIEEVHVTTKGGIYPVLPDTVEIRYKNAETGGKIKRKEKVEWEYISLDKYVRTGEFTLEGTIPGLSQKAVAKVSVTNSIGTASISKSVSSVGDAYIQKSVSSTAYSGLPGTVAISTGTEAAYRKPIDLMNFTNQYSLKVKAAAANAYNRRILIKFDINELNINPAEVTSANINLKVFRYDQDGNTNRGSDHDKFLETKRVLEVRVVDNNWEEDTISWDIAGALKTGELISSTVITNREIVENNHIVKMDVLKAVQESKDGKLSFLISIPPATNQVLYDINNSGFDAISKEGAEKYAQMTGKENDYAPSLMISSVYETGYDTIAVETDHGTPPQLPDTIAMNYSDKTKKELSVTWEDIPEASNKTIGTFTVKGTSSGTDMPIIAKVTVKSLGNYQSIKILKDITVRCGTAFEDLTLPMKAEVTMSNGETKEVGILSWSSLPGYDAKAPVTGYTFSGVLDIIAGYTNTDSLCATVKLNTKTTVSAITVTTEESGSTDTPSIEAGESILLMAKVEYSDNEHPDTDVVNWSIAKANDKNNSETGVFIDQSGFVYTTSSALPGNYIVTVVLAADPSITASFEAIVTAKEGKEAINSTS